ncbi:hypothetical protein R5R61_06250 [Oenococcus oeni]
MTTINTRSDPLTKKGKIDLIELAYGKNKDMKIAIEKKNNQI